MMAIWRAIQNKPANSYVLKWRYNLASPDRDALMNGRFAPEAAVHVVGRLPISKARLRFIESFLPRLRSRRPCSNHSCSPHRAASTFLTAEGVFRNPMARRL